MRHSMEWISNQSKRKLGRTKKGKWEQDNGKTGGMEGGSAK
jgi:hypothetical protein